MDRTSNFKMWIHDNINAQETTFYLVEEHLSGDRTFYWLNPKNPYVMNRYKEVRESVEQFPKEKVNPFLVIPLKMKKVIMECFMLEAQNHNYSTPNHDYMKGQIEVMKLNADRTHEALMAVIGQTK